MSRATIKLLFRSVQDIWQFVHEIKAYSFEVNTKDNILICACTKDEEVLAVNEYGAREGLLKIKINT